MGSNFNQFTRVAIGIGRPESREPAQVASYVLSKFNSNDRQVLKEKLFAEIFDNHLKTLELKAAVNQPQGVKKKDLKRQQ